MEKNITLTENSFIYQSAKRLLNRELEKCTKLLKENEEAWNEYMDLKLHYAFTENVDFEHNGATITFSPEEQNKWFYRFCDDQYDYFLEWCGQNGIDYNRLRDEVGRTSSFYLGKLHNNYDDKYLVALLEAVPDVDLLQYVPIIQDKEGNIIYNEEEALNRLKESDDSDWEGLVNEMLGTVETMYDDLKNVLDEITDTYKYIKEFKENQVEIFKEFVKAEWLGNVEEGICI